MNEDFLQLMPIVFHYEGIYSNNPNDPGGETFLGISRHYFPNWTGWKILDKINKSQIYNWKINDIPKELMNEVYKFYYENFYLKLHLDKLPKIIRKSVFDSSINIGKRNTIRFLQRVVGVTDDGIIGPITLKALNSIDPKLLLANFKLERIKYYTKICYKNRNLEKFLLGWINRTLID